MDYIAEAVFLETYFKGKELAIAHARWAYFHVEKAETQYFWLRVIKQLGGDFEISVMHPIFLKRS